jgi:hypothetical protein
MCFMDVLQGVFKARVEAAAQDAPAYKRVKGATKAAMMSAPSSSQWEGGYSGSLFCNAW